MTFAALMRHPSAFLPLMLSAKAASLALLWALFVGTGTGTGGEGPAARVFQLLLGAQLPLMAWFAFAFLPRERLRAAGVLALHVAGLATAAGTVLLLERAA